MCHLSTAYVRNHRARVQHRRGALVVTWPERSQRIPLEPVDALIVLGGAQVTTQALDACVRRGVRVAALGMGGGLRFTVSGPTSGKVHLRMALFGAVMDDARSLAISKATVAAKTAEQPHRHSPLVEGCEGPDDARALRDEERSDPAAHS